MLKGFKLSIIAIAISAPLAHADTSLGSDSGDVSVNVNSDDGNIGNFTVYNGTNSQIATFTSGKFATQITTSNGNKLTVSNSGVSLSNSSNDPITLSGIANGIEATDAVNVSQLNNLSSTISTQANAYTNQEVTTERNARIAGDAETLASANAYTNQRFNNIETKYQAAVASSIAIASLPQPTNAGYSMVSFSVGQWEKEQGYAVGVSGVTENNKWVYKAAGTGNSRGDFGGGVSFGFQWK